MVSDRESRCFRLPSTPRGACPCPPRVTIGISLSLAALSCAAPSTAAAVSPHPFQHFGSPAANRAVAAGVRGRRSSSTGRRRNTSGAGGGCAARRAGGGDTTGGSGPCRCWCYGSVRVQGVQPKLRQVECNSNAATRLPPVAVALSLVRFY